MAEGSEQERRRRRARDLFVADVDQLMVRIESDLTAWLSTPDPLNRDRSPREADFVSRMMVRLLDLWVQGASSVTDDDVERMRRTGAEAARAGVALQPALRVAKLAPRAIVDRVQQVSADQLEAIDFSELGDLILEASGRLGEVFEVAYLAETARLTQSVEESRRQLVVDLLAGQPGSLNGVEERSAALGLALPTDPMVLAVVVSRGPMRAPDQAELEELVTAATDLIEASSSAGPVWGIIHSPSPADSPAAERELSVGALLAPAAGLAVLSDLIAERHWGAAAARVPSWPECSQLFLRARSALEHGPTWAFADRRVLTDSDVMALELIRAPSRERSAALATLVLGELLEPEWSDVLAAVEAYLASGSAPVAARRLDIHPHTLRRRLNTASELLGRDLHTSWDVFVVGLASTAASARP